jgi:hypothetical protein
MPLGSPEQRPVHQAPAFTDDQIKAPRRLRRVVRERAGDPPVQGRRRRVARVRALQPRTAPRATRQPAPATPSEAGSRRSGWARRTDEEIAER